MDIVDIIAIIIAVATVLFITIGSITVKRSEIKNWNNGYCKQCGLPWILYDRDSQGGRMYKCDNWHYCDISYKVDKIKEE